jgi:hypothetical protein
MENQMVHKVVLSSGKEVLLRTLKIKHQRLAAQAASGKAGNNPLLMALAMREELLKILIAQVDGKAVAATALEDLDALFSYEEFSQLNQVLAKLTGEENSDSGKFKMEIVPIGGI